MSFHVRQSQTYNQLHHPIKATTGGVGPHVVTRDLCCQNRIEISDRNDDDGVTISLPTPVGSLDK